MSTSGGEEDIVHRGPWAQTPPSGGVDQNAPTGGGGVDGSPPEPHLSAMQVQLAKLEGEVSAFRLLFAVVITILIGGFAFLGVQVTRVDGKISATASDVQGLPERINGNLLALTRTLADAISAAKQTPPQVILLPPPSQAPTNPSARP